MTLAELLDESGRLPVLFTAPPDLAVEIISPG
jgi:hypothetical protein